MPSISKFFGITIRMYPKDHNPPHFHASYNGKEAIVDIAKAEVEGKLPDKERKCVEAWAAIHKDELMENWDLLAKGQLPKNIAPLS